MHFNLRPGNWVFFKVFFIQDFSRLPKNCKQNRIFTRNVNNAASDARYYGSFNLNLSTLESVNNALHARVYTKV